VTAIGTRSFTLAVEIRDPASGERYATAATVVVGSAPLRPEQRRSLSRWSAEHPGSASAAGPAPALG
jgi:acyl-CoA thioester hydrolase